MSDKKAIKEINQVEVKAQAEYDKNPDEIAVPSFVLYKGIVESPVAKLIDKLISITHHVSGIDIIDSGFSDSGIEYPDMAQDDLQENIDESAKKHDYITAGKCQQLQKNIDTREPEYMTVSLKKNGLYHVDYTDFKDVVNTASALISNITTPAKN